jgi:hypothetical protein
VAIILATTWLELETTRGENPLVSNSYHGPPTIWLTLCVFVVVVKVIF